MSTYEYNPLESEEVRLLELKAGDEQNELVATLQTFRLPIDDEPYEVHLTRAGGREVLNAPPYDALSYVWGDPNVRVRHHVRIVQEGNLFHLGVKPNLYDALRRLRKDIPAGSSRYLWVDAICMNQSNIPEKNSQIQRMALIYNRADSVCVWLGGEDSDSGRAMEFIETLLSLKDFDLMSSQNGPGSASEWAALHRLMQRPWFNRRWIVQEISLARHAMLYCGDQCIPWQDFSAAVALFVAKYADLRPLFQQSSDFHNHPNYLGEVEALGARSLVEITTNLFRKSDEGAVLERLLSLEALISTLTLFEAGSPHDTIYSVLWLSHDAEPDTKETQAMSEAALVRTPTGSPELAYGSPASSEGRPSLEMDSNQLSEPLQSNKSADYFTFAPRHSTTEQHGAFLRPPHKTRNGRGKSRSATDHNLLAAESHFNVLPQGIIVDYNSDIYDVYRQFLEFAISRSMSIDILCHPWAPEAWGLPTWIPQLSSAPFDKRPGQVSYGRVRANSLVGIPGLQRNYNASGKTKIYPPTGFIEDRTLRATGFILDTVKTTANPASDGVIPSSWLRLVGWQGPPDPVPDRFWRTLVADRGPDGQRYPPAYYALACKWVFEQRSRRANLNTGELLTFGRCPSIVAEFLRRVQAVTWNRVLCLTEGKSAKQLLALVPEDTMEGDLICVLYGCSVPVVLRRYKKRKSNVDMLPPPSQASRTRSRLSSTASEDSTRPGISLSRVSSTDVGNDSTTNAPTAANLGVPSHTISSDFGSTGVRRKLDSSHHELPSINFNMVLESHSQYELIGECYVHGMMAGEGFKHQKETGSRLKVFHIV